jgi:methionyl-tRNA formyltransferase
MNRYRGSSPIIFTLRNQDKETGVSLIKLAKKMDTGDILTQAVVDIEDKKYYYRDVECLLADVAIEESVKVLQDFRHYEVVFSCEL